MSTASFRYSVEESLGEKCPILLAHGTADDMVSYEMALKTNELLHKFDRSILLALSSLKFTLKVGCREVEFFAVQGMGHTVSMGIVREIQNFLRRIFA